MFKTRVFLWAVATLFTPALALAQQAQTAKWVHVRAGPAREYPLVSQLPPAAPVSVQGCLSDFSWCDVITPDGGRGWIYGGNLVYPSQNGYVPIIGYGNNIGVPVVTFVLGAYWGSYYRQRMWYGDWHRWNSWSHGHFRPGYRPPPPPHRPDVGPRPPRPTPQPPRPPVVRPTPQPTRPPVVRPTPQPTRPPVVRPTPQPTRPPVVRPTPQPARPLPPQPMTRPAPRPDGGETGGARPQAR
jgi:uncharacterized protein YraI